VRLDHLLSKEHHEKSAASPSCSSREESVPVVGVGLVHNNIGPCFGDSDSAGTLLGPEATPVLSRALRGFGSGGCRFILVVGCGVCLLDSGCEHLSKIAVFVAFLFELFSCVCKCLRAHGGCLGIRSR
jgi:hypothetical protein